MKIDLHSKPDNQGRLMIPVSEFSFAAYPIVINQTFRCAPHLASAPVTQDKLPWRGWIQQILHRLRRAFGTAAAVPEKPMISARI
jgi:predicted protein tyrosine phosphatase